MKKRYDIFFTYKDKKYFIVLNDGKVSSITEGQDDTYFYFYLKDDRVDDNFDIFENAMKALIRHDINKFNLVYVCLYGMKKGEEYQNIAVKVFKEYWNELYNLAVADDVFKREHSSLNGVNKIYDFFEE